MSFPPAIPPAKQPDILRKQAEAPGLDNLRYPPSRDATPTGRGVRVQPPTSGGGGPLGYEDFQNTVSGTFNPIDFNSSLGGTGTSGVTHSGSDLLLDVGWYEVIVDCDATGITTGQVYGIWVNAPGLNLSPWGIGAFKSGTSARGSLTIPAFYNDTAGSVLSAGIQGFDGSTPTGVSAVIHVAKLA